MINEQNWYDNILQHMIDMKKPAPVVEHVLCHCLFCKDVRQRKESKDVNEFI